MAIVAIGIVIASPPRSSAYRALAAAATLLSAANLLVTLINYDPWQTARFLMGAGVLTVTISLAVFLRYQRTLLNRIPSLALAKRAGQAALQMPIIVVAWYLAAALSLPTLWPHILIWWAIIVVSFVEFLAIIRVLHRGRRAVTDLLGNLIEHDSLYHESLDDPD